MLRRHELRILGEMERQLAGDDPALADRMTSTRIPFRAWLTRRRAFALAVAALSLLCLALGEGAAFFTTALLAAALLLTRDWTFRSP
ncbi:DUF3040 domain-containing protein [Saccharopolyspora flava]|uniref:DUF3040 domain-containing protein n=1 Tax=Saccharopolyspora flava TaxID=95161 RepID=A0A1I6V3W6_9PSEU|nr:DUF3040 domain-containing protein [Saccharopolyspora flava]SFT08398.1 Protein of unknown function [Saccharopolyspora flava]